MVLPPVDPEVAALTLEHHLDRLWTNRELDEKGWTRTSMDELHTVVSIPAHRPDGTLDTYYFNLGAEYYDAYPPTVLLVAGTDGWPRARAKTIWWPKIANANWFGLHDSYQYKDAEGQTHEGQLVCFSMTAEYYMSEHNPTETQKWQQGRHTVAATLNRLAEVLSPPYYEGPDATHSS